MGTDQTTDRLPSTRAAGPLIIGAGPTGLSAGLFLTERGLTPRIVERRLEPSRTSKAFGVNPRTMELLEPSGVTERMLSGGWRMKAFNLHHHGRVLGRLDFSAVRHRFPFMLIHSQAKTETLLEEALRERGITVKRGVEITGLELDGSATDPAAWVTLQGEDEQETIRAAHVLAADGAHSSVRKSLGIGFEGKAYEEAWRLYDVELDTPLASDEAHAFLLDDGAAFAVRLEGDVWRVLGNARDLLSRLPEGTRTGRVKWESEFGIEQRLASRFQSGPVALAGDAAHIHSGLGARGMNLGIEDAYVFAGLLAENRLQDYDRLRRPVVAKVMRTIGHMTEVPRGRTARAKLARRIAPVIPLIFPVLRRFAEPWVMGLDHPVRLR